MQTIMNNKKAQSPSLSNIPKILKKLYYVYRTMKKVGPVDPFLLTKEVPVNPFLAPQVL